MGRYSGKRCRLASMFGLTSSFFLVEIIVGYVTNSMALVADSFHMLSDIAALIIAYMSVRMAPKSWDKSTYGWARAEVLGALVNAVFLIALCFSITVESLKRFYEPEDIDNPQLVLIVGGLGLVVNLLGLCLFHEHGHSHGKAGAAGGTHSHLAEMAEVVEPHAKDENPDLEVGVDDHAAAGSPVVHFCDAKTHAIDGPKKSSKHSGAQLNMRGVFLHVMADALGSVVVIISALIMWLTDWTWRKYVDPALSLTLVVLMLHSVWPLLIESALILLQTVPTHIEIDVLKRKLLEKIDGVLAVHEFHVWQLTGDRIIASAHIRCFDLEEYMRVAEKVKEFFHNEGIHSTTIQPEFLEYHPGSEYQLSDDCMLSCPKGPGDSDSDDPCKQSKCCPKPSSQSLVGGNGGGSKQNTPPAAARRLSGSEQRRPFANAISLRGVSANKKKAAAATATTSTPITNATSRRRRNLDSAIVPEDITPPKSTAATEATRRRLDMTAELDLSNDFSTDFVVRQHYPAAASNASSSNSSTHEQHPLREQPSSRCQGSKSPECKSPNGLRGASKNSSIFASISLSSQHHGNSSSYDDDDDDDDSTPIFFEPRANTRVVKIISKQSNV